LPTHKQKLGSLDFYTMSNVIIPRDTFYTTDISVTLWILNKNKKARTVEINGKQKNYRNRASEIPFTN